MAEINKKVLDSLFTIIISISLLVFEALIYKLNYGLTFDLRDEFFKLIGGIQLLVIYLTIKKLNFKY